MAIIFTDGFDAYGTSNNSPCSGITRKWPANSFASSITVQDGRFGGKAAKFSNDLFLTSPNFAVPTMTVGFALRIASNTASDTRYFLTLLESSVAGINVGLTASGELEVRRGTSSLFTTSGLSLAVTTWYTIELTVTADASGSYELRVNGQIVASDSGIDTRAASNAWIDSVKIGAPTGFGVLTVLYDDLYITDDDQPLIDFRVQTVFPVADVSVEATPSTGSDNFALVADNPADTDSSYVETDSGADVYAFDSIDGGVVHGVAVNAVCRETDAEHFNLSLLANSGASDPQTIGSSDYVNRYTVFNTDPDTSEAWTAGGVNSAEFGWEVT